MTDHEELVRSVTAEIMRFVRGAQGMTHDERAWFMERIAPIISKALSAHQPVAWSSADVALKISQDAEFRKFVAMGKTKSAAMQAALIASPPPAQQLVGIVEEVTHAYGTKVHWKRKMEEGETLYAGPMVGKL